MKKLYAEDDTTASNLSTNARVVFKLCSLLITMLTYHVPKA